MNRLLWLLFWGLAAGSKAYAGTDSLLDKLSSAIEKAPEYDAGKMQRIEDLKSSLRQGVSYHPMDLFALYERVYNEYRIFQYDSAYAYAGKLAGIAYQTGDKELISKSRLQLCFILLSSGLFRETFDSLRSIDIAREPDSLKAVYYTLMGRYYYDLAFYDNDWGNHSFGYDKRGGQYMDSALRYYTPGTFEYIYYKGLRDFKASNTDEAEKGFRQLLASGNLTDHQFALTASTLSGIYMQKGRSAEARDLMIEAAIADIRSSTKETFATFNLADLLFKEGDVKHASLCIESAIANAEFYGARQRKVQVSSILSLIEGERINAVEAQRRLLIQYAAVVTLLVVLLGLLALVIRRQNRKLRKAQQTISEAHEAQRQINARLAESNRMLEESNAKLAQTNGKLEEANKIKEEYIGYFFNLDSEFFVKLERLKKTLDQKVADRKFEDIRFIVNNIHLKQEKQELLKSFDTVFLRLFPQFVSRFNALFKPEDQIKLKDNEPLNIDLRIFALIRMGISDNEKIAQILEYSVNTIYAYKTRIKSKSIVPNEEFEARIMEISTI